MRDDRAIARYLEIIEHGTKHVGVVLLTGATIGGDVGSYDSLGLLLTSAYNVHKQALGDLFIPWTAVASISMALPPSVDGKETPGNSPIVPPSITTA